MSILDWTTVKKKLLSFQYKEEEEGDSRLLLSAAFVFLIISLFVGHLITRNLLWKVLGSEPVSELKMREDREKIYEVLVEQQHINPEKRDEYKALSDRDSAGGGGLTEEKGFHTSSPFREFIFGTTNQPSNNPTPQEENMKKEEDVFEVGIYKSDPVTVAALQPTPSNPSQTGQMMKIPFNYRFQQDFLFRWDGNRAMTVPTKELAGYHYFKNMLKQIEGSFAPPGGGNFAYRDIAGTVVREGIKPGMTKVQFLLNDQGKVLDVRLVSSQGQELVDRACMDSIRGQNFGVVPEEVKAKGMIFGINFIFPGIFR
ncbi:energy transducer TonB [Leptospira sp. GIMC2001]|uniref:energy transducer TonB n=1 Tax=Leptospira sp. GIMC2001 TaxID=1513297 RepID=UPI002349FDF4|nr:TonB-dependent receptor [Leptospira sp. GIMC2001]WCL49296.1 TonB-dependent receptor [Leptospira sp. GIMC2001]